jgi:hypothetical protein
LFFFHFFLLSTSQAMYLQSLFSFETEWNNNICVLLIFPCFPLSSSQALYRQFLFCSSTK